MNITEKKTTEKGIVKTQADLNYAQVGGTQTHSLIENPSGFTK